MPEALNIFGFLFLAIIFTFTMKEVFRSASFRKKFADEGESWVSPDKKFSLLIPSSWKVTENKKTFTVESEGLDPVVIQSIDLKEITKTDQGDEFKLYDDKNELDEDAFEKLTEEVFKKVNGFDPKDLKNSEILYDENPLLVYFEGAFEGSWLRQWVFVHQDVAVSMGHRLSSGLIGISKRNEAADLLTENFSWNEIN
jgi:hypothetical protein